MTVDVDLVAARRDAFAGVPFIRLLGMRRGYSNGNRTAMAHRAHAEAQLAKEKV